MIVDAQVLLADNLFVDMAGVFEYDLELKEKGDHRKFLTQTASFKQVCALERKREEMCIGCALYVFVFHTFVFRIK